MRLYSVVGKPICWFALPIGLSFAAYMVPQEWYGRPWLGFSDVEYGYGLFALAVIYLCLAAVVLASTAMVRTAIPLRPALRQLDWLTFLWLKIVTALAGLGTLTAVWKAVSEVGLAGAWDLITGGLANELKMAMYEEYSAGVMSLRYLVVLAAPGSIAIGLITGWKRRIILFVAVNTAFMLIVALLSSRLTLIASVVVLMMTMARYGARIRVRKVLIAGLVLVSALIVLSNTRNINYYQEHHGVDSPVLAGLADTLTYLATPAHGSMVGADYIAGGDVTTTGIDPSLTTNSALMEAAGMGWGSLLYFGVILSFNTVFFFAAYRSCRLEMIVGGAATSYAFWEFWRINLFYQGIHMVWIIFGILLPVALRLGYIWLRASLPEGRSSSQRRSPAFAHVSAFRSFFYDQASATVRAQRAKPHKPKTRISQPRKSPFRGLPEFQVGVQLPSDDVRRRRFGTVSEQIMAERESGSHQANVA